MLRFPGPLPEGEGDSERAARDFHDKQPGRAQAMLRAPRHRNFRLFVSGQSVSLIGTWVQRVALGWLLYRLTGSALLLGAVPFAGQFPTFLLAAVAGVLADRWNRHRILVFIFAHARSMVQALLLASLVLTEAAHIWQLIALNILLGAINAFDMPTRQSFLVQMIQDRKGILRESASGLQSATQPSLPKKIFPSATRQLTGRSQTPGKAEPGRSNTVDCFADSPTGGKLP